MSFPKLRHFTKNEAWGEPERILPDLLYRLDEFREYISHPIIVTCGTQGRHMIGSQHYLGRAVDIVLPNLPMHPVDLVFAAERFGFTGLGLYLNWRYKNAPVLGLHLDMRELPLGNSRPWQYREARWLAREDNGKQVYDALSVHLIKKYAPPELMAP